jgi:hypothetical protein
LMVQVLKQVVKLAEDSVEEKRPVDSVEEI